MSNFNSELQVQTSTWVNNIFELYSSRLTTFILVVDLFLAYLILSLGYGLGLGWVGKSDFKENPKSDLDLD